MPNTEPDNNNESGVKPESPEELKKRREFEKLSIEVEKLKYGFEKEKRHDKNENAFFAKFQKTAPTLSTFVLMISGILAIYFSINKALIEGKNSNDLAISRELIGLAELIDTLPEDLDFDSRIKIQIAAYDLKILPFLIDSYVNLSLTEKENKKKELIKSIRLIQYNKPGNVENVEDLLYERWLNYIKVFKDKVTTKIVLNYFDLLKEVTFFNKKAELKKKFKEDISGFVEKTGLRDRLFETLEKK